ncbi:TonB-dependent receptor [Pedobacter sp.]|uniref:SusC/RagA family TonB-linked outer membrane protein n=1 Tax=Pedobacter sp. TaxID=1411316 RepID=UPI0031DD27AE
MKKKLLLLVMLATCCLSLFAQQRTITGTVTSQEDGKPIPGASIRATGTNVGTQTDVDGKFVLKVNMETKFLEFFSIGFIKKNVPIANASVLNISLESDVKSLNEVMVVAYGTQKKQAITGSVATIGTAEIEKRTVTNATQLLAGASPGISTSSANGQPGSGVSIRLRGFGSFAASSEPLIILDGSQYDGSIGDINVNDIDNLSILKDASSSALYGARAANGVIIITTKKGKTGASQLNASINQGFSERSIPEYERLNAFEYYPAFWQALKNNYMFSASPAQPEATAAQNATNNIRTQLVYNPFNVANNAIVGTDGKINPNAALLYDDFDWFGPLERTGKRTDVNLSFSGRNEKSDYYASLGYLDDKGYILKSDIRRFTGRINANSQVKPWLKTGFNLSATLSDLNNAYDSSTGNATSFVNVFSFTRGIGPIYPVHARDAAGNLIYNSVQKMNWYDYGLHPGAVNRPQGASPGRHIIYETMLNDNLSKRNSIGGRGYVELRFLKDFTFTPTINIDIRNNGADIFWSPLVGDGVSYNGYASNTSSTVRSYTFNQILNYNKSFTKHTFGVTLGHENYNYTAKSFNVAKSGIVALGITELGNFVSILGASGVTNKDAIESYFSKLTYNYDEKYFLEGSLRRDGSSRFHPNNRWGTFFSAGASWSISKEEAIKKQNWIDDLRLKISYGEVGNNALSSFYAYDPYFDLGWNNNSEGGVLLSSLATPDLKWETSKTTNAGLTFSLFKRKLYGEFEYFKRGSGQLIFSLPLPQSDPVISRLANIGSMENRGFELQLGSQLVKSNNFSWDLITNWTILKNEITKMPVETPTIISGTKRREVGKDFYAYWLRQYAGVDPSDGSALYIPAEGTAATSMRTVNGQQYVTNQTFAKFDYSGTAIPDLAGSIANTFNYKDVSLSFLVNYQLGGKFYDSNYQGLMSLSYGAALHKDALKAWTTTNTGSDIPRLDVGNTTNINAASTRWLIDASYLSLTNVNLSYQLPRQWLSKVNINRAKLFVGGENLLLFSKRKGLDPREAFDGVNSSTYLPNRIISFGINLSL